MCLPNLICAWARVPKCPQFLEVWLQLGQEEGGIVLQHLQQLSVHNELGSQGLHQLAGGQDLDGLRLIV